MDGAHFVSVQYNLVMDERATAVVFYSSAL